VRQIFPAYGGEKGAGEVGGDAALAELYGFPSSGGVRANMVTSADGAAAADGLSAGLSSPGDRRLFAVLRALADVILVGAGTARSEGYKPVKAREEWRDLRTGRTATPPIALVSGRLDLDPGSPLFTEAPADARTIVITCETSPADARAAFGRVADVIVAGNSAVDFKAALAALRERGLARVSCEGGPHLLADLAAAGLLDELCLTISPLLAGPGAGRILTGTPWPGGAQRMELAHTLEEDGFLFCRYTRAHADARARID
jgi:riboflavin biosynthesis pyrimidine reductase